MSRWLLFLILVGSGLLLLNADLIYAGGDANQDDTAEKQELPTGGEEKKAPPWQADLDNLRLETNILWTCIAAFLVFFMQAGFAMVEAGFTRAKNAANILMKNLMDFSIGSILFWLVGFGIMFGASAGGWFGTSDFMPDGTKEGKFDHWTATFLIFQTVFAATAATIVSGGVAERTKFVGYLGYSLVITAVIYPVFGHWAWASLYSPDKGWLEKIGFVDFAGSTVVHSVGGWAALAGTLVLGPRIGKYSQDGSVKSIPGHSMPLAALGVFILWLGWFGFNPGSTTCVDGGELARVAVTTNLAAAAGAIGAMIISWIMTPSHKPQLDMSLNGALAGLVAITCPCYNVTFAAAALIGLIGGILVYFSVRFFDLIRVDDPVGAISVHGVCGAWGTLSAGLFGAEAVIGLDDSNTGLLYGGGIGQLGIQITGILAAFVWVMGTCLVLFMGLRVLGLLRVSPEDETRGLDLTEHATSSYQPIS